MNKINLTKISFILFLGLGTVFFFHERASANETQDLKNQIKALQEKVAQLEKQASSQAVQSPSVNDPYVDIHLIDNWDPFAEIRLMQRHMNQMMRSNMIDFNPKEDIKQTPDHYVVSMDIPGMDKDKINVEVKSGMLIVSGERNSESKEDKGHQFYRQERSFGRFYRSMALPSDAKSDNIDAQYQNGVLTVKIARVQKGPKSTGGQKITVK